MNIFCNLTQSDSLSVLFWLAGAWLLGLLLGRMLWGSKVSALTNELAQAKWELEPIRAELDTTKATLDLKMADLSKSTLAIEEQRNLLRNLEDEKSKLHGDLYESREQMNKIQADLDARIAAGGAVTASGTDVEGAVAELTAAQSSLAVANARISELEAANSTLTANAGFEAGSMPLHLGANGEPILDNDDEEYDALQQHYTDLQKTLADSEAANAALQADIEALRAKAVDSVDVETVEDVSGELAALKNAYSELQIDNENLRADLAAFKGDETGDTGEMIALPPAMGLVAAAPEELAAETIIETPVVEVEEVVVPSTPVVLEVAAPVAEIAPLVSPKGWKADDLKVIEGIGPKVEEVLKNAGINDWEALAKSNEMTLRSILQNAGSRYRILNPSTWAKQARLLKDAKWDEFTEYTSYLVGGIDPNANNHSEIPSEIQLAAGIKNNDLRTITGITPKIVSILGAAGIKNWEELAGSTTDDLTTILEQAGDRYSSVDTETWPTQARLLVEGKFDDFRAYANYLTGSKETDDAKG